MDPASIVEDTEWTLFHPQPDGKTDGQGETNISLFQLPGSGGYDKRAALMMCVQGGKNAK